MSKQKIYEIPTLANMEAPTFIEGDVQVFNTINENLKPSDYIGKYHIHILCRTGKAQFSKSGRTFTINTGDLSAWAIDSRITNVLYSSDFDADILMMTKNFLMENNPQPTWATKFYLYIKANPVFHLNDKDWSLLSLNFNRFKERIETTDHIFHREILGRMMQIFLYDLWDVCAAEINRQKNVNNNTANIFSAFLDLVRQKNMESREVTFYAVLLCVTPKYLSEVVRRASGKPASYWINGYALQEVVALLKRQDITISEISSRLNFYSQSHLSRFVKKMLGVSPTEYRNNLETNQKQ